MMNFMERRKKFFADIFKATGHPEVVYFTKVRRNDDAEVEQILANLEVYKPKKRKESKEGKALAEKIRKELGYKRSYRKKGEI